MDKKNHITNKQRVFLESVIGKKLEPYYTYRGAIQTILKQGYYYENTKKQLNDFGYKYMEKYFHATEMRINGDESYYKDVKLNY